MINPRNQWCVQIDITNVCNRACSNCTRLVGHGPTFYMSVDEFVEAIKALKDFPTNSLTSTSSDLKLVGIIGGEPLMHPQFANLIQIMAEHIPIEHRGLWTGLDWKKSKYSNLINTIFNDDYIHNNLRTLYESQHSPVLVATQDIIEDEQERLCVIDQCWLQQSWASTITPKGYFFCEVAGAIDWAFGGPGGLQVEPNCWNRPLEDFQYQKDFCCQKCGIPLNLEGRLAVEEVDDISSSNLLALAHTKRIKNGQFVKYVAEEHKSIEKPWIYHE